MPTTYQAPGVYVEEVPGGSRPIEGVGTSVAAFVGFAEKGPLDRPVRVTNWTQYTNAFGGFIKNGYMPLSVYGFFANGGGNAWIGRIGGDVVTQDAVMALPGRAATPIDSLRVTSKLPGVEGNGISIEVTDEAPPAPPPTPEGGTPPAENPDDRRFRVRVTAPTRPEEVFEGLTLRRGDARNVVDVINNADSGSKLIMIEDLAPRGVTVADRQPAPATYTLGGGTEQVTSLTTSDFQG